MGTSVVCISGSHVTRLIFKACLRREGFDCLCFENGMEALIALQQTQETPSVIFLARTLSKLPLTNGYQMVHLLRAKPRYDQTALVLLAQQIGPLAQWYAHRIGVTAVFPKQLVTKNIVSFVTQITAHEEITAQNTFGGSYDTLHAHSSHPTGMLIGSMYNRHAYGPGGGR